MDRPQREGREVVDRGIDAQVAIQRVPRLERDLLARLDLDGRRHIRVPAVVSGARLLIEVLTTIDGDAPGRRTYSGGCHAPCSSLVVVRLRTSIRRSMPYRGRLIVSALEPGRAQPGAGRWSRRTFGHTDRELLAIVRP